MNMSSLGNGYIKCNKVYTQTLTLWKGCCFFWNLSKMGVGGRDTSLKVDCL